MVLFVELVIATAPEKNTISDIYIYYRQIQYYPYCRIGNGYITAIRTDITIYF